MRDLHRMDRARPKQRGPAKRELSDEGPVAPPSPGGGPAASTACTRRASGRIAAGGGGAAQALAMSPLLVSALAVAVAEIGDRTQLLAILLAARFGRPWPILAGILVATLANHALAATAGYLAGGLFAGRPARIVIALAFLVMAAWTLVPDRMDEESDAARSGAGVFVATTIAFFLVEFGDKTQIATVALAAQFQNIALVAAGTTLGMMTANAPAVFLGRAATAALPLRTIRWIAAAVFAAIGAAALIEAVFRR
jgi:putative Ca2+/H+ antiporter (TMEM165/GDT1 family)